MSKKLKVYECPKCKYRWEAPHMLYKCPKCGYRDHGKIFRVIKTLNKEV